MIDEGLEKAYFVVKLCGGLESAVRSKVGWFAGERQPPSQIVVQWRHARARWDD